MFRHVRNIGFALALSTAALVALLILQALLLFRGHIASLGDIAPPGIEYLSICDDGRHALLLIREPMTEYRDRIRHTLAPFSTMPPPAPLSLPTAGLAPWRITGARQAPFAFVASKSGDLYSFDLRGNPAPPIHFGRHPLPYLKDLACTDDASLVVAANISISCWDRATARCLWSRDDCEIIRGMFVPCTHRFFAALTTGQIAELDAHSGVTLREFPSHSACTTYLDISLDSQRLVAANPLGDCVVSVLAANEPLWSRQFPSNSFAPRFSPDGRILVAADVQRRPRVTLLCADSGDVLGELTGARAMILGLTISPHGAVYAWDVTGTVSVWDLASRALLFQFRPEQFK